MKSIKQKTQQRNILHNHPLLKKGGVHEKPAKAKRQQDKVDLKKLWSCLKLICL